MTPSLTTEQRNSKLPNPKMLPKPQSLSSNTVWKWTVFWVHFSPMKNGISWHHLLLPFSCKSMVQDKQIGSSLGKHSKDKSQRYPPVEYPSFSATLALTSHDNFFMFATTTLFTLSALLLRLHSPHLSCLEGLLFPLARFTQSLEDTNIFSSELLLRHLTIEIQNKIITMTLCNPR